MAAIAFRVPVRITPKVSVRRKTFVVRPTLRTTSLRTNVFASTKFTSITGANKRYFATAAQGEKPVKQEREVDFIEPFEGETNADLSGGDASGFGTLKSPILVPSEMHERIVGCQGGLGREHEILWHRVEKNKPLICLECGQVFELKPFGKALEHHDDHGHEHGHGHGHGEAHAEHVPPEEDVQLMIATLKDSLPRFFGDKNKQQLLQKRAAEGHAQPQQKSNDHAHHH